MANDKAALPAIPAEFADYEVPRAASFEWEPAGKMFVGFILGMREQTATSNGRTSTYMSVDAVTADGEAVVFSAGKILANQLANISDKQKVCIQYIGKVKTSTGNDAKDFKVFARPA